MNKHDDETTTIMREEIEEAVNRLKKSKAPGVDNISAKEMQAAGNSGTEILLSMCRKIWEEEKFIQMWKKSIIIPLQKKDTVNCDNYRGVSSLPHCEKVMASAILQRIRQRSEEILSEAQEGFRPGCSTIDQLFTLRRLTEMYIEYGKYLYVCYIDFQKAFDSV